MTIVPLLGPLLGNFPTFEPGSWFGTQEIATQQKLTALPTMRYYNGEPGTTTKHSLASQIADIFILCVVVSTFIFKEVF